MFIRLFWKYNFIWASLQTSKKKRKNISFRQNEKCFFESLNNVTQLIKLESKFHIYGMGQVGHVDIAEDAIKAVINEDSLNRHIGTNKVIKSYNLGHHVMSNYDRKN